ncbi:cation-translocating P-type ATPase [Neorhizobium sp. JUb45]|uniref:cation-translocating P-type ATPase n=1 Tax=Neorhizobium sp. JUb45 TaxID=2485113 RepID=UPI001043778A|nr:cation-translocating P-type ATPase [Neorhizobium sp. JUb45]TCR01745.1 Cu2+-exporting ATPase [Neorhizobium sp. JUb45]
MSCCAPGTEGALDLLGALPSTEELLLSARDLGNGMKQTDLGVPDVYCGACIATIEKALGAMPAVEKARVNLSTKRVSVLWHESVDGETTDPVEIVRTIVTSTGYSAHLFNDAEEAADALKSQLLRGVAVCGFAAANIMLLSVSVWSGADASTRDMFHWISAMIAAPALIYGGRFFYQSAWNVIRRGRTNMDVPIALAITLSYGVSLWETMHHGHHAWFDATVSLLFFLLIGRTLDHIMRERARASISGLARLSPRGAMVLGADDVREYRPVSDIRPGDRIAIAAGERIPVDGIVESGASDLDVSIVNGESAPHPVTKGASVQAGMLSLTGSLVLQATAAARDSFLSEIMSLMEAAEGSRAGYRRLADRVAQFYSPAVHLLAITAFLSWGLLGGDWKQAMLISIAVLIITCPCALGLAVPVVQVVAAGRLFRNGIMVKDGSAMERLAEVEMIVFDKTGTLTVGRPRLLNGGEIDASHLSMAAGLAAHSRHPLSQTLYTRHTGSVPFFEGVEERPGEGLQGFSGGRTYRLGSRRFACDQNSAGASASSEVVLSVDGAELAAFRFEDRARSGAEAAMRELLSKNMSTAILSGDRAAVVERLAKRLSIDAWQSDLSPRGKTDAVSAFAEGGRKVMMVGDGINDAPALRAAHVSMAPATAADIGRQAADFVFMHESLAAVPFAHEMSRRAGTLIRQNFGLAIGYNVIAVPIALAGYATPLIAAVAMSTSSLIVVANALRLNHVRAGERAVAQDAELEISPGARTA